ncbi:MAG: hypothetical protein GY721_01030 [Deltaproteobacteria bacterium]|nr:hypothetical protein [Deltaproteobacteria bacterium]
MRLLISGKSCEILLDSSSHVKEILAENKDNKDDEEQIALLTLGEVVPTFIEEILLASYFDNYR